MDAIQRRELLRPTANPGSGRDYVITLRGKLLNTRPPLTATVVLRYVPDRQILEPANFESYLEEIAKLEWLSLEAIANAILIDTGNELAARWTQVTLRDELGARNHEIAMEDHQPGWFNEDLLYRLPPV